MDCVEWNNVIEMLSQIFRTENVIYKDTSVFNQNIMNKIINKMIERV